MGIGLNEKRYRSPMVNLYLFGGGGGCLKGPSSLGDQAPAWALGIDGL